MNQQPPAQSSATGSVKPNPPSAPLTRRRKPAEAILFRKPNSGRHITPNRVLPQRKDAQTNGIKPGRSASPAKPPPSVHSLSGFSDPRVFSENIPFKDYKLVTTKRDLLRNFRYHLMHLAYPDPVDIRSEQQFPKPAHLHRRDPRYQSSVKEENGEPNDGLDAEEREELNKRKEMRRKEKEENMAQVAPGVGTTRNRISNKKKTQQVNHRDYTPEERRRMQTNYEEKFPWHLEDWNATRILVGQNQIGPARMHAALAFEPSDNGTPAKFRMIPVEKVYSFEPKRKEPNKIKLTIEEVEAAYSRKKLLPEALARLEESAIKARMDAVNARRNKHLFTGGHNQFEAGRGGEEADLDFEDDFADDEEGDLFEEKDEDEKTAEKKIKEDQLQANFLDFKDLQEYDMMDERERREEEAKKLNFRDVRKALARREGNYNQGSDSEDGSSTDSEEERQRLEAQKLANVKKEEDASEGKASRLPSGANTPSGRKEKHAGTASDREGGKRSRPPKRPGSPNLSDASGTDASVARKKKKTKHIPSSQPTPGPSRPRSPDNTSLDPSSAATRPPRSLSFASQTAGSDTDGGAMSDGTKQRIRLKVGSASSNNVNQQPVVKPEPRTSPPTSRTSSPPPAPRALLTAEEVRALIPPAGIPSKDFMTKAGITKERLQLMMPVIREVARFSGGRIHLKEHSQVKAEGGGAEGENAVVKKEAGD
jgi:transcription initiation factor TFIIF subunit alpha